MAKNLRRQKIQFLPCAFLVSRHGIFKIHLSQCVFLVFWRCVFFAYVWCICDAIFAKKCIFLRVWHLCLAQAYFFYALGTCVLCRCIYFTQSSLDATQMISLLIPSLNPPRKNRKPTRVHFSTNLVWKSDLHVYCECIFLPAHCAFFLESAFLDCTCGNKNQIFAASVFWQHMFS